MHELIIIGAGPAGLTAALYAGRYRLKTLLLEKMAPGGRILMSEHIENYPGFPGGISTHELMGRMEKQIKDLDIEIRTEEVQGIDCESKTVKTDGGAYTAEALIISAGAAPRKLGVPGEERLVGRGVSYCATCDGPLYKDKDVVIVGGGDSVAEEALYLARFTKSVSIVHRRDKMRASAILQEKLSLNKKINFILNSIVTEINGAEKLDSVSIKDVTSNTTRRLDCKGIFIYVGQDPETAFLKGKLELDQSGFIVTGEGMETSQEGVFACGDCRKKSFYQVITAAADGAIAANSANKYIAEKRT
ncbi:MAG: thioredoxin-disulfide reductase [Candidatus Omnitrophota bacterium]|nr:thioredoxin-disulfide reductase [Candidatus Omnitrophota bacterium]